jgi:hypothetical protein
MSQYFVIMSFSPESAEKRAASNQSADQHAGAGASCGV